MPPEKLAEYIFPFQTFTSMLLQYSAWCQLNKEDDLTNSMLATSAYPRVTPPLLAYSFEGLGKIYIKVLGFDGT